MECLKTSPTRRDWGSLREGWASCPSVSFWIPPPRAFPCSVPGSSLLLRSRGLLSDHCSSPTAGSRDSDRQPVSRTTPWSSSLSLTLPHTPPLHSPTSFWSPKHPSSFPTSELVCSLCPPPSRMPFHHLSVTGFFGSQPLSPPRGHPWLPCLRWPLTPLFSEPCLLPSCSEITRLAP